MTELKWERCEKHNYHYIFGTECYPCRIERELRTQTTTTSGTRIDVSTFGNPEPEYISMDFCYQHNRQFDVSKGCYVCNQEKEEMKKTKRDERNYKGYCHIHDFYFPPSGFCVHCADNDSITHTRSSPIVEEVVNKPYIETSPYKPISPHADKYCVKHKWYYTSKCYYCREEGKPTVEEVLTEEPSVKELVDYKTNICDRVDAIIDDSGMIGNIKESIREWLFGDGAIDEVIKIVLEETKKTFIKDDQNEPT